MNLTRQWPRPGIEDQFSHVAPQDTFACISYSVVHSIESQIRYLLGDSQQYSERFLAKMSNTSPEGNSITNVLSALWQYGLVKDEDWPEPVTFSWQEYYAPIPQSVINKGKDFLRQWDIGPLTQISFSGVNTALLNAPLIVFLPAGTPIHAEIAISPTECFNTYPPYITPYPNSIYKYFQFIIKPKKMSNIQFVKKAGTQEYGFYIPALSEDALKDKALNFGYNILNPDDTIAFDEAKDITGL